MPTLNASFNYAFSDKWLFRSKLGWLAVEAELGGNDGIEGEIVNAAIGMQWLPFKNVGIFANYQVFDVNAEFTDGGDRYAVDYRYEGPVVGLIVAF